MEKRWSGQLAPEDDECSEDDQCVAKGDAPPAVKSDEECEVKETVPAGEEAEDAKSVAIGEADASRKDVATLGSGLLGGFELEVKPFDASHQGQEQRKCEGFGGRFQAEQRRPG